MSRELLDQLIELVEQSRLRELVYTNGRTRIRLVKREEALGAAVTSMHYPDVTPPAQCAVPPVCAHVVKAGVMGVFFRRPSPEAAPCVQVGDAVEVGQCLGVMEAMKMLNPIEADRSGRISAVLAEDGATVDMGAPLFAIEPQRARRR
jgi:acetyl-CoA carboxylase biotin carboxyl carrier protein